MSISLKTESVSPIGRLQAKILDSVGLGHSPSFLSLTIALTEACNLDCWMCDFAVSKGLREFIPWTPQQYVEFIRHPYFQSLKSVSLTGGEPFARTGISEIYAGLIDAFPKLNVFFSSNATLLDRMKDTFVQTRDWRRTKLFTSIDGVEMHDVQRKVAGAFRKSMNNLQALKEAFPELSIDIKFTVTPVNHSEILAAYRYCTERGFNFTVKMVENNQHYTSKLSFEIHRDDFRFTDHQMASVRQQLEQVLSELSDSVSSDRRREMVELLASLDPDWRRDRRCLTPRRGAFLDSRMNFFTCKEYAPLLNLASQSLDELETTPAYSEIVAAERENAKACTRCTSQMRIVPPAQLLRAVFGRQG